MKILLLTQVLPHPPDSGPKVKTWNLIKWLAAEGHEVTLVSFLRGEPDAALAPLRRHCRAVHGIQMHRGLLRDAGFLLASLANGEPFLMRRDRRAAMTRLVRRLGAAQRFDAVHADQLNMMHYARQVPGTPIVLDAHNALWLLYERLAQTAGGLRRVLFAREARLLRAYEGAAGRTAAAVLAVSAADRDALAAAIGPDASIMVVPIAVDPDELPVIARRRDPDRLVHLGTMYWPPNVDAVTWFLEAIYPRIRAAHPTVGFDVIGARPPWALRRRAAATPGVRVTGYVADPLPWLERAAALVVPLRAGAGMRVKILTALAHGVPVVTTRLGCEGIAAEPGRDLLVADSAEELAAATIRLLGNPALGEALARNGRRLVEAHYAYRPVYAMLRPLYPRAEPAIGRRSA